MIFMWQIMSFLYVLHSIYFFVDDIESNPFIIATIAVSVFAGVLIIVAVILVILLIKKQTDINRTCLPYSFLRLWKSCLVISTEFTEFIFQSCKQ